MEFSHPRNQKREASGVVYRLLICSLVAVPLFAGVSACRRKPPATDSSAGAETPLALPPVATGVASPAPQSPPASAKASALPVVVASVPGWLLEDHPKPGLLYRYVLASSAHGPESPPPSVTVVATGEKAQSAADYAAAAETVLKQRTTDYKSIVTQDLPTESPPFFKAEFQYRSGAEEIHAMQLYFVRGSGEVIVITFMAKAAAWESMRDEFRRVASAIQVSP